MSFKRINESLIAETFEDARQYDLAKLKVELERLRGEVVEVKVKPDQETLDFWNNEATIYEEIIGKWSVHDNILMLTYSFIPGAMRVRRHG